MQVWMIRRDDRSRHNDSAIAYTNKRSCELILDTLSTDGIERKCEEHNSGIVINDTIIIDTIAYSLVSDHPDNILIRSALSKLTNDEKDAMCTYIHV